MSYNSGSNRARNNFKSASRFVLVRFWNYSRDYSLNCTPLGPIGHFRVPLCLCFKASLSAKPFLLKWLLICMKMKLHAELIFIWKVSHLDSFWNRGTRENLGGHWDRKWNLRKLKNHGAVYKLNGSFLFPSGNKMTQKKRSRLAKNFKIFHWNFQKF